MFISNQTNGPDKFKPRTVFWILLALGIMLGVSACTPTSGPLNEYYVSPEGVDSPRRGRSVSDPWQTISYALDQADYTLGTPRINLAAGIYLENLAITRPAIITGVGVGDPLYDSDISVIEPAFRPSSPIEPYHTISGGIRVELFDLVFRYGRLQVTEGSLYVEGVSFWHSQQRYGLRLRDVSAFNIIDTDFSTQAGVYSDYAVEINNSVGEIHGGTFGDGFDHAIIITKIAVGISDRLGDGYIYDHPVGNVLVENVTILGSNVFFADGIRISQDASATIRDSSIIRDSSGAEAYLPGSSDGSAAGIDVQLSSSIPRSSFVEITGNTISGFDVGIAMNLTGKRVIASGNDLSGVSFPVKTHFGNHPDFIRADSTIDFGGGALGSSGGNIFRDPGSIGFFHQYEIPISACFNEWNAVGADQIENRIYDQLDDPDLGRVRWDCSEAILAETPDSTPEIYEILPFTATPTVELAPEKPTLNKDVLCWLGPGPSYETVSSVLSGVQVTLVGQGLEGLWWIIDNPRYPGVSCWLPGEALDVDPNLDLSSLLHIPVPPLPTLTPTPITGCLYKGQNDNQAVCYPIAQCPVPFDQTQGACTP